MADLNSSASTNSEYKIPLTHRKRIEADGSEFSIAKLAIKRARGLLLHGFPRRRFNIAN